MCVMEIHPNAHRTTMIQAIAHNLSTIDRDLDMLRNLGRARKDAELVKWVESLQNEVNHAYANALGEFEVSAAKHAMDPDGHIHYGTERNLIELVNSATKAARKDETR